jgi:hypothetical protein
VTSPDGRWAFTLYAGGDEAFIHALDTERATAVCIDLPMVPSGAIWRKQLRPPAPGEPIRVLDDKRVVAVVNPETFEVSEPEPAPLTEPADDEEDESDAIAWLAIAGGGGLLVLGLALALRRREGENPWPRWLPKPRIR